MFSYTRSSKRLLAPASLALLSLCFASRATASAQTQSTPDNSRTNKVQDQGKTADQQKNDKSDVQITAEIRRAVIADKSLSTYGHNVKIIVAHGAVTLKGPVHSEEEKQSIAEKAAAVVGQKKVTDQITIKQ